jgi:CheY-like chemotaxis protein
MSAKRIVVADDEPHIRHVLALKLEKGGFAVHPAADGQEALEICQQEPPDLVITDFQMPMMTGIELCRRLRANPATERLPVILLTARGFDLDEEQTREAQITAIMSKPFSPAEVLQKANEILADVAARRCE